MDLNQIKKELRKLGYSQNWLDTETDEEAIRTQAQFEGIITLLD